MNNKDVYQQSPGARNRHPVITRSSGEDPWRTRDPGAVEKVGDHLYQWATKAAACWRCLGTFLRQAHIVNLYTPAIFSVTQRA